MLTKDGFVFVDPTKFAADVGADLPQPQAKFMANSQMPVLAAVFNFKLTTAAWHDKLSYAIIATEDRVNNLEIAERMAKRAGSQVTLIKASHFVHISQPRAVARDRDGCAPRQMSCVRNPPNVEPAVGAHVGMSTLPGRGHSRPTDLSRWTCRRLGD